MILYNNVKEIEKLDKNLLNFNLMSVTPLHCALTNNRWYIAKLLINMGHQITDDTNEYMLKVSTFGEFKQYINFLKELSISKNITINKDANDYDKKYTLITNDKK